MIQGPVALSMFIGITFCLTDVGFFDYHMTYGLKMLLFLEQF